ncbi:hypothetical protein HYALB_00010693 [Hymenoscyphus albidus]|uniref:Uncharacterized protein n=1 Tax=Hymenoscyphus albidus TaxID=595503 RepID=A0A9N9PZU5_9HELO|nr:hypothetical protein HYALB_00010693 [Hymenoscyphus albidus]
MQNNRKLITYSVYNITPILTLNQASNILPPSLICTKTLSKSPESKANKQELSRINPITTGGLTPEESDAEAYFQKQIEESLKREPTKPPTIVEQFVAFFTTPFASLSGRKEKDMGSDYVV